MKSGDTIDIDLTWNYQKVQWIWWKICPKEPMGIRQQVLNHLKEIHTKSSIEGSYRAINNIRLCLQNSYASHKYHYQLLDSGILVIERNYHIQWTHTGYNVKGEMSRELALTIFGLMCSNGHQDILLKVNGYETNVRCACGLVALGYNVLFDMLQDGELV